MKSSTSVVVLAGGYGGARMAHGFALLGDEVELTVIGNTGDDLELHGLYISPDLDTVMYTLAGMANAETGWGVRDETWSAAAMLESYGEPTWFRLGDRDLATHIVRSAQLAAGDRLTDVTRDLCRALDVDTALLPMTDDPVRTKVRTKDGWLDFQDYFVRRHHQDDVEEVRFDGIETARPSQEVLAAVESANLIVVAPSNPYVSVAPILSLGGILDAVLSASAPTIAISPIVGGAALRGPAAQMMSSLGTEPSALGIAAHYAGRWPNMVGTLVIDEADAAQADAITALGMEPATAGIVIATDEQQRRLARELLRIAGLGPT
ncbi:MAG: 2-phospho-L-lactate transferase [Chloroflexota bacterium]